MKSEDFCLGFWGFISKILFIYLINPIQIFMKNKAFTDWNSSIVFKEGQSNELFYEIFKVVF